MKARSQSCSIPKKRSKTPRGAKKPGAKWNCARTLRELRALGEQRNVDGMARFAIRAKIVYGVATPRMDQLARRIGKDHALALALWSSGVHDAKILAGMIAEVAKVTPGQMERWVRDFDNWAVCDGTCCHLFAHAQGAWSKAQIWSARKAEFEKRAGFALMAYLAVHDKTGSDRAFIRLLPMIRREAHDDRNFVRKAVNWALRQIGKRNLRLNRAAVREGERIQKMESPAARWIAADALRELTSAAVQKRLKAKAAKFRGQRNSKK
jgi:3-methyladenine DNA glycosylase AlkD